MTYVKYQSNLMIEHSQQSMHFPVVNSVRSKTSVAPLGPILAREVIIKGLGLEGPGPKMMAGLESMPESPSRFALASFPTAVFMS